MSSSTNINTANMSPTATFQQHLNNLPKELYESIEELVFTAGPNLEVTINETYTTPSILQVFRQTRAQAAESYYQNSIFLTESLICRDWIATIPAAHIVHTRAIHLDGPLVTAPVTTTATGAHRVESAHEYRSKKRGYFMTYIRTIDLPLLPGAVKMWVCLRNDEEAAKKAEWTADYTPTTSDHGSPRWRQAAFMSQVAHKLAQEAAMKKKEKLSLRTN